MFTVPRDPRTTRARRTQPPTVTHARRRAGAATTSTFDTLLVRTGIVILALVAMVYTARTRCRVATGRQERDQALSRARPPAGIDGRRPRVPNRANMGGSGSGSGSGAALWAANFLFFITGPIYVLGSQQLSYW